MLNDDMTRSALITGASRGIGLQIAKRLAEQGFILTISSRSVEDLDAVAPGLRQLGAPAVTTIAADMADLESLPAVIDRHRETSSDMSALIINAGVGSAGNVSDYSARRVEKSMVVNFRAPLSLIQLSLPLLRAAAARHGNLGAKIIVLSSITGVYAERGLAVYGASKAATLSLVETVNAEESANGVLATAIAPGYVDTDMSAWIHDKIPPESMIPADDIAILVRSLLSLSRHAMIGRIVVARGGADGYRA